ASAGPKAAQSPRQAASFIASEGRLGPAGRALRPQRRREHMSVTIGDLRTFKERQERFVMLTAYDYPTARILDEAGVPVLLVGDSVADNILGYETTVPVTMEEMLHHTRAVARGAKDALVVGDLPFMSYQTSLEDGIRN